MASIKSALIDDSKMVSALSKTSNNAWERDIKNEQRDARGEV
jgi:hypothetical protein